MPATTRSVCTTGLPSQASRQAVTWTHVLTYNGKPITRKLTDAWKRARVRAKLPHVRVHDLKRTFGRRLRAAGVSFADLQGLFEHRFARITTQLGCGFRLRICGASLWSPTEHVDAHARHRTVRSLPFNAPSRRRQRYGWRPRTPTGSGAR